MEIVYKEKDIPRLKAVFNFQVIKYKILDSMFSMIGFKINPKHTTLYTLYLAILAELEKENCSMDEVNRLMLVAESVELGK